VLGNGVSTGTTGAWLGPKQSSVYLFYTCEVAHQTYDAANRGTLNVKWLELNFPFFLNFTLQYHDMPLSKQLSSALLSANSHSQVAMMKCCKVMSVAINFQIFLVEICKDPTCRLWWLVFKHLSAEFSNRVPQFAVSYIYMSYMFLTYDFTCVKHICSGLFSLKLYTVRNGHVEYFFSWSLTCYKPYCFL
jgi:hypothetical protein